MCLLAFSYRLTCADFTQWLINSATTAYPCSNLTQIAVSASIVTTVLAKLVMTSRDPSTVHIYRSRAHAGQSQYHLQCDCLPRYRHSVYRHLGNGHDSRLDLATAHKLLVIAWSVPSSQCMRTSVNSLCWCLRWCCHWYWWCDCIQKWITMLRCLFLGVLITPWCCARAYSQFDCEPCCQTASSLNDDIGKPI